jgi:hypothetical protein
MHLFILLLLTPIGLNYNAIIWPWNAVMIIFIFIVFYNNNPTISFKNLLKDYNKIPFILIGILPLFCFLGFYDNYFSFNLYSGNLKYFKICVDENQINAEYKPYISKNSVSCGAKKVIFGNEWSLKEMNVVILPEVRFYKGIIEKWNKNNPNSEAQFFIYQYPFTVENVVEYK